jgi:hypothetical protein
MKPREYSLYSMKASKVYQKCGGRQCGLGDFNMKTQRKKKTLIFKIYIYF